MPTTPPLFIGNLVQSIVSCAGCSSIFCVEHLDALILLSVLIEYLSGLVARTVIHTIDGPIGISLRQNGIQAICNVFLSIIGGDNHCYPPPGRPKSAFGKSLRVLYYR